MKMGQRKQAGTTLPETLVAVTICTIVVFSLAVLVGIATQQTKASGQLVSLCTAFAAQKLDQLSNLTFKVRNGGRSLPSKQAALFSISSKIRHHAVGLAQMLLLFVKRRVCNRQCM